jgi:hypothetical protein
MHAWDGHTAQNSDTNKRPNHGSNGSVHQFEHNQDVDKDQHQCSENHLVSNNGKDVAIMERDANWLGRVGFDLELVHGERIVFAGIHKEVISKFQLFIFRITSLIK